MMKIFALGTPGAPAQQDDSVTLSYTNLGDTFDARFLVLNDQDQEAQRFRQSIGTYRQYCADVVLPSFRPEFNAIDLPYIDMRGFLPNDSIVKYSNLREIVFAYNNGTPACRYAYIGDQDVIGNFLTLIATPEQFSSKPRFDLLAEALVIHCNSPGRYQVARQTYLPRMTTIASDGSEASSEWIAAVLAGAAIVPTNDDFIRSVNVIGRCGKMMDLLSNLLLAEILQEDRTTSDFKPRPNVQRGKMNLFHPPGDAIDPVDVLAHLQSSRFEVSVLERNEMDGTVIGGYEIAMDDLGRIHFAVSGRLTPNCRDMIYFLSRYRRFHALTFRRSCVLTKELMSLLKRFILRKAQRVDYACEMTGMSADELRFALIGMQTFHCDTLAFWFELRQGRLLPTSAPWVPDRNNQTQPTSHWAPLWNESMMNMDAFRKWKQTVAPAGQPAYSWEENQEAFRARTGTLYPNMFVHANAVRAMGRIYRDQFFQGMMPLIGKGRVEIAGCLLRPSMPSADCNGEARFAYAKDLVEVLRNVHYEQFLQDNLWHMMAWDTKISALTDADQRRAHAFAVSLWQQIAVIASTGEISYPDPLHENMHYFQTELEVSVPTYAYYPLPWLKYNMRSDKDYAQAIHATIMMMYLWPQFESMAIIRQYVDRGEVFSEESENKAQAYARLLAELCRRSVQGLIDMTNPGANIVAQNNALRHLRIQNAPSTKWLYHTLVSILGLGPHGVFQPYLVKPPA